MYVHTNMERESVCDFFGALIDSYDMQNDLNANGNCSFDCIHICIYDMYIDVCMCVTMPV